MKKQCIFILDPKSQKLVQVCDVRDLTSAEFESLSNQAKKNITLILKKEEENKRAEEQKHQKEIDELQNQISDLQLAVSHLLGLDEFDEETLKEFIRYEKKEGQENE